MAARQRNQVTDSMISTVSEAFQFEDFLGEKTTLKDRVPKNKANLKQKIIHFSRQVQELPIGGNPLESYKYSDGYQKKNTFDDYMGYTFGQNFTTQPNVQPQSNTYSSYQYAPKADPLLYTPPSYTNSSKHFTNVSSYNNKKETKYFESKTKPNVNYSASGKLNFNQDDYNTPSQNVNNSQPNYNFSKNLTQNQNKYSPYSNSNQNNYKSKDQNSGYGQTNVSQNWNTKPTSYNNKNTYFGGSSGSSFNKLNYPNQAKSSVSKSFQTQYNYKPAYEDKKLDNSYDHYGEYAKDFTSSDILAILQKNTPRQSVNTYTSRV